MTLATAIDAFIGRESDLASVVECFTRNRLVTVVGPPGTGKTRLAHEFGAMHLQRFDHRVWWCEVTEVRDAPDRPGLEFVYLARRA